MYNKFLISLLFVVFLSQVFAVEAILSNGKTVKASEITFSDNKFILTTESGKMILNPSQIQSFSFIGSAAQEQTIKLQTEKETDLNKSSLEKDAKIVELQKQVEVLNNEKSELSIDNDALRGRIKELMGKNNRLINDESTQLSSKTDSTLSTQTSAKSHANEKEVGKTPTGLTVYEGLRGGRYHYSKSGNKVYEKRKK